MTIYIIIGLLVDDSGYAIERHVLVSLLKTTKVSVLNH